MSAAFGDCNTLGARLGQAAEEVLGVANYEEFTPRVGGKNACCVAEVINKEQREQYDTLPSYFFIKIFVVQSFPATSRAVRMGNVVGRIGNLAR